MFKFSSGDTAATASAFSIPASSSIFSSTGTPSIVLPLNPEPSCENLSGSLSITTTSWLLTDNSFARFEPTFPHPTIMTYITFPPYLHHH